MTIQKSDELNELFSALSKIQGNLDHAKKDKSGYKNRYKYTDLTQYIDVSKELLEENGICVLQMPGSIEIIDITEDSNNLVRVPKQKITTFIGHSSGQFISETMEIIIEKIAGNSWGQSTGSAISYSRKYSLAGGLGMTQEDDDNQIQKNNTNEYINQLPEPSPDPLITQLIKLIKYSGCDIKDFTDFHKISSKDILSVKKSIDNFDELLILYKNTQKNIINLSQEEILEERIDVDDGKQEI